MRPIFHSQCPRSRLRRKVDAPCQVVRTRDFRLVGTRVLDLSTKGMLLETDMKILTGEDLIVSVKSPSADVWYDCEATVARIVHGRRRHDQHRALGIKFETLDPWSELLLCEQLRMQPVASRHTHRASVDARRLD